MKIIIAGKAASGKDFLKKRLMENGLTGEVSFTTRPPRKGEVNGVDYIFVHENVFLRLKEQGDFYECQNFNGWWYGTTKISWYQSDVFIFTPSGIMDIKPEDRKSCFIIYLDIPLEIRKERLLKRSDADKVDRRLKADEEDFANFKDFDLRITNPDF